MDGWLDGWMEGYSEAQTTAEIVISCTLNYSLLIISVRFSCTQSMPSDMIIRYTVQTRLIIDSLKQQPD